MTSIAAPTHATDPVHDDFATATGHYTDALDQLAPAPGKDWLNPAYVAQDSTGLGIAAIAEHVGGGSPTGDAASASVVAAAQGQRILGTVISKLTGGAPGAPVPDVGDLVAQAAKQIAAAREALVL